MSRIEITPAFALHCLKVTKLREAQNLAAIKANEVLLRDTESMEAERELEWHETNVDEILRDLNGNRDA